MAHNGNRSTPAPNGHARAFLQTAHYRPSPEVPDDEYPLLLTTGRTVYHFHTRTKTGRAPELNAAAPDVFVEIAREDAARLGVNDGDWVEVASRRGTVRAPARVGGILPGHLFLPVHSGDWDEGREDHARAPNELTVRSITDSSEPCRPPSRRVRVSSRLRLVASSMKRYFSSA